MELTDSEMGLSAYLCTGRSWKFEHSKVSIATSLHYLEGGDVLRKKVTSNLSHPDPYNTSFLL